MNRSSRSQASSAPESWPAPGTEHDYYALTVPDTPRRRDTGGLGQPLDLEGLDATIGAFSRSDDRLHCRISPEPVDVRNREVQYHSGAALSLPVVAIGSAELKGYRRPLLSLKLSEFTPEDAQALNEWVIAHEGRCELFLHAFDGAEIERS